MAHLESGAAMIKKYLLEKIERRGETVYSLKNPLLKAQPKESLSLKPAAHEGRFLRDRGRVEIIPDLSRGAHSIFLKNRFLKPGLTVITFSKQRKAIRMKILSVKTLIQVEGFVKLYRGKKWQIRFHRGMELNRKNSGVSSPSLNAHTFQHRIL